jgi:hypothetical protein
MYGRAAARPDARSTTPNPPTKLTMLSKPTSNLGRYDIKAKNLSKLAQALNFRTYNTPKILQTSMLAIWGLGLIWIPVTIESMQAQRAAVKTIAKDSIPSVMLAQRIIDAMSDMDTMVASELLSEVPKSKDKTQDKDQPLLIQVGPWEKPPIEMAKDKNTPPLTKRRNDLAERLTLAAANSTFPGEDQAIRQLILHSGDYFAYADRAQAAHNKGDQAEALRQYQLAAQVLDQKFIPVAHQLREINVGELEKQYSDSRDRGASSTVLVALMGLLTIGALVALQLFLHIRTRRTLNPMLLGTTIVALLFLLNALSTMVSTGEQLRVLKEDSYNSLLSLRLARALLYGANSDESRYLLDPANANTHEAAFRDKTNQAFGQSDNQAVLTQAIKNLETKQPDPASRGYFATAIGNITFPVERDALTAMMVNYKEYMAIDQQIRGLVAAKQQQAAVKLCLGGSNDAFNAMKKAMDDVKDVNEQVATTVQKNAMDQLDNYEAKATIALGVMATLVFFGLQPRLREYR